MSLPQLPDGYFWSVKKHTGREQLAVRLWAEDAHPMDLPIGERDVDIRPYEGETRIIAAVESAAAAIWSGLQRDVYVNDVIDRNWPVCPK